jgi:serine/threonine-protein kinase
MDLETEAAQRVGTTICNKWTLERLIGTGGMAAVYVAHHKIGRQEALKILHADVARDPELRARFEQEANAVNRFKHPGTVEVRDIDVTEDGAPFLVMELLDGQSLGALARQPAGVPLGDLLRFADELLDVLAAAHAQGIIHRDIKPDNLFVLHDGRLKVLDFGIARVRAGAAFQGGPASGPTPRAPAEPSKLRTRVGATLGTAPYMPPEQIRGAEIDARADLFAVGATMFRLIARRRIHDAENESETLFKMSSLPAPPLASVAPDAPRDVCLVVDRALKFDREQRYPDALTMQADVRALRAGQPPPFASRAGGDPAPAGASPAESPPSQAAPSTRPATAIGASTDGETRTTAASPGALQAPPTVGSGATTPPEAPLRVPVLDAPTRPVIDATTRPAMMVLGAAGLGAPLAPSPAAAVAAEPDPRTTAAASSSPVGVRTLRSVLGPEGQGHTVSAQGYAVATPAPVAVLTPTPLSAPGHDGGRSHSPGPRTQVSGVAPPVPPPPLPLAPGESIPVLPAPPPPKRRHTLPGTEISVWPLVAVGVVFAGIGVALTLWLMLRGLDPSDMATYQIPTVAPTIVEPKTARPPPHGTATSMIWPGPAPVRPPVRPHR